MTIWELIFFFLIVVVIGLVANFFGILWLGLLTDAILILAIWADM